LTTAGTTPAISPSIGDGAKVDERIRRISPVVRALQRPELGALLGAIGILVLFALVDKSPGHQFTSLSGVANWTDNASTLGIMAVAVALLMIGGEFDLSAGVMTGSTGLLLGLLATKWHWNVWPAIIAVLVFAAAVGFLNGYLVMRTKLPSFIVTLATFFCLRGINLGYTKQATGTVRVDAIDKAGGYKAAHKIFSSTFWAPHNFRISLLWWIAIAVVATWLLTRTRVGNWIFGVGGDANSSRNTGVPVNRTKIGLFMTTSLAAALVGIMTALRLASVQAGQGVGEEFNYIIAAVVGGCLLTGGFGSAIGASLGALIVGMAFIGIAFAHWNTDWQYLFLGLILFAAVMVNTYVRKRALGVRR
jgi:simple sugar transport system permease protein